MHCESICKKIQSDISEIKKESKEQLNKIVNLEKSKITTDLLVENFTEVSKELSNTMKTVKTTMVDIQISLKENTKDIANMNSKIDKLDDFVQEETEKNKIDIRDINKDTFTDHLKKLGMGAMGAGGLYGIVYIIQSIVEKGS